MARALETRFRDADATPWSDEEVEEWARRIFAHQFASCAPYRAFCLRRGVTPETVDSWEGIPAVPATAFKYFDFVSVGSGMAGESGTAAGESRAAAVESGMAAVGPGAEAAGPESPPGAEVVFRTSGTTRGTERRGRHHVPRLELYRASLIGPFRRALLGDVEEGDLASIPFLSLIPSPDDVPDSSLSFMVASAAEQLGATMHWLVDGAGGWRGAAVEEAAARLSGDAGPPALLLGTALSFAHLLEAVQGPAGAAAGSAGAAATGGSARKGATGDPTSALLELLRLLPDGSRAMETGGFKGVRREVSRADLYAGIEEVTRIPAGRIVNEYGMTELLSQLYEPVLTEGPEAKGMHLPAPWLRVRALDPATLRAVREGREGILAFFDPANLGSIAHVLTEDVGRVEGGRVRLLGRATGAEPRGCSRAMDDLMSVAPRG